MIDFKKIRPVVMLGLIALTFFVYFGFFNGSTEALADKLIVSIKSADSIEKQVKIYRQLIEKVGPEIAQEKLYRSGLPFTGQTHLLNHTVGEGLYEKYGPAGLVQCKDYFLSSCYHGFIVLAIARGGMEEVEKTMEECRKSGPAVFTQCAHAVGHGLLASEGYSKLVDALKLCDKVDLPGGRFPMFNCYDGVFMENIWAVHEGEPSPDRWVKKDDPFYPCDDPRIGTKYQLACWSNQPALMYQLFDRDIKKVGLECEKVLNPEFQKMCFDGLARQIHPLTKGSTAKTLELCGLMSGVKWIDFCIVTNAVSSFSVGDRVVPFEICSRIREVNKEYCYNRLFGTMDGYVKNKKDFQTLCSKIQDEKWREKCESGF